MIRIIIEEDFRSEIESSYKKFVHEIENIDNTIRKNEE